jgi:hypothetical protein
MSQIDDLRRLLQLKAQKQEHEDALKPIATEIEIVTARILDRWAEDGVSSMKVDGRLLSLRRQVWARVLDRERIVSALEAAGLGHLLTPNSQSLSAVLREWEENGQDIPAPLVGVIDSFERFSLSVRNGRS